MPSTTPEHAADDKPAPGRDATRYSIIDTIDGRDAISEESATPITLPRHYR